MRPIISLLFVLPACTVLPSKDAEREQYFLTEVKPILQQHCLRCHDGALPPPALNLTRPSSAFQRSANGRPYIVAEDPDCSLLISAVQRGGTHPKLMPRKDISLTEDQIGVLREWIEDGARWPKGPSGILRAERSPEGP
jgi:hypothetical protein